MARLRYLDDTGHVQMKLLEAGPFIVGRADTCQLTIDSDMISREHMRIDVEKDGRFVCRDLGSRNKTYVNGELIRETVLTGGAVIRVGDHVLEFVDETVSAGRLDLEFLTPDRKEPPDCEWIKVKAPLLLTVVQLERLAQLASGQAMTARAEDIADSALGQVLLELSADRGLIALRGEGKTDLHPLAHRALARAPGGSLIPVSQSFALAPILQRVAGLYPRSAGKLNAELGYAVTGVVAPLTFHGDVVGILYVDRPRSKKPFRADALQYLAAAGAHIGSLIGAASRRLAQSAGHDGAAWMSTLRRLQTSLSDSVSSSDSFAVSTKMFPGRLQCGDFVSVIHLDEQRCGIFVVDGGGHGIEGVAQACSFRRAIQTALSVSEDALTDPAGMFNALNRVIASSSTRRVLPCLFVGVDCLYGKMAYVNAGGMAPVAMVGPGRLVTLDQVSLVLGVDADYGYETSLVDLPDKFRLVCFTDGLVEATSAGGDPFGEKRLHDTLLEREAFAPAADVVATIAKAWSSHMSAAQPSDDATVVVVSRG